MTTYRGHTSSPPAAALEADVEVLESAALAVHFDLRHAMRISEKESLRVYKAANNKQIYKMFILQYVELHHIEVGANPPREP